MSGLAKNLVALGLVGMSPPSIAGPLAEGDVAPRFAFEDIEGYEGHIDDYRGWVVVYTAAEKDNSEELMEHHRAFTLQIIESLPEARVAYINVANVSMVPRMLHGVVRPILRHISAKADREFDELLQKSGTKVDSTRFRVHLVADWSGDTMAALGINEARPFRTWLACNQRIVGVWEGDSVAKDFMERLIAAAESCPVN